MTRLHSRISLADLDITQRHSRFRRITFENAFPAVQVIPFTAFTVIRKVFRCRPFLSIQFGNITYNFAWNVNANGFYNVLGYSLPHCHLRLHVEYKYTIVRINTRHNVRVNYMFLAVALFQLHSFRIQSVLWCNFCVPVFVPITAISWNRWLASKLLSWLAFWSLLLFEFPSHETFHVEYAT